MKKRNKVVDIVCVSLVALVFGSVAVLNIIQKDRPAESVAEKRKLAEMPEFSWQTLWDGSYFSGVASFISDTFIERDKLVGMSKEMDTLKGFDYSIDGNDNFALLSPVESSDNENEHAALSDKLTEAMDSLDSRETETETTAETDGSKVTGGEIVDVETVSETKNETQPAETDPPETKAPEESETSTDTEEVAETEPVSDKGNKVTAVHL